MDSLNRDEKDALAEAIYKRGTEDIKEKLEEGRGEDYFFNLPTKPW
ncbi:hypothetical protein ACFL5K_04330 [Gemmatimonadota bacterium]